MNKDIFHMSCEKQDICDIVLGREITTEKTLIDLRTNPYSVYKHKFYRVRGSEDDSSLYLSSGGLIVFLTHNLAWPYPSLRNPLSLKNIFVQLCLYSMSTDFGQTSIQPAIK